MTKTIINPSIIIKIKNLSKCFWYWENYYIVYSSLLWIPKESLKNKYPKEVYNNKYIITEKILLDLQENWKEEIIKNIISYFYTLNEPFDKDKNPWYSDAIEELKDFKSLMWKDPIKEEIEKNKFQEKIQNKIKEDNIWIEKSKKLEDIKNEFISLNNDKSIAPQKRGFILETLFYNIILLESLIHNKPYKTEFEQIDWSIKYWSFDYLVEIKWTEEPVKQKDVSIFDWKIKRKWLSTRWLILSINWFDDSAISSAEWDHPKMFFIDWGEFFSVLSGYKTISDILHEKEDNLARIWKVYKR